MIFLNLNLCGLEIQINSDAVLNLDGLEKEFYSDICKSPEFHLTCLTEEFITDPAGSIKGRTDELAVFQKKEKVWRGHSTGRNNPFYALLHYDLENPVLAEMQIQTDTWEWASAELWQNMALPQLLAPFGALILHASYIEVNGRAVLFTAASGTGKSTQAALWEKHRGAVICNGDKTGLRVRDGVLYAYGLPFCGTSGICHNVTLPVAAIVALSQAPENHVTRLTPAVAAQTVMANVYADRYIPEEWNRILNLTLDVVSRVPVFHLACTPDERAVEILEKYLS